MAGRIFVAQITTDMKKLWSCPEMRKKRPDDIGTRPIHSGQKIVLQTPAFKAPYCKKRAWWVLGAPDDLKAAQAGRPLSMMSVCEHQIDLPKRKKGKR